MVALNSNLKIKISRHLLFKAFFLLRLIAVLREHCKSGWEDGRKNSNDNHSNDDLFEIMKTHIKPQIDSSLSCRYLISLLLYHRVKKEQQMNMNDGSLQEHRCQSTFKPPT
jgi:hypothetical protein